MRSSSSLSSSQLGLLRTPNDPSGRHIFIYQQPGGRCQIESDDSDPAICLLGDPEVEENVSSRSLEPVLAKCLNLASSPSAR